MSRVGSFEVFPSLGAPRFLFPAGASIRDFPPLLRPRSRSINKSMVSSILRTLPIIVDSRASRVTLETAERAALAEAWYDLVPPERTAIHVGYRNGHPRPTLCGFDERGSLKVIGKYARGAIGLQTLAHEHGILQALQQIDGLRGSVPSTFGIRYGHLGGLLLMDAFNGNAGPLELTPAIRCWLDRCVQDTRIPVAQSSLLRAMGEHLPQQHPSPVRDAYRACMSILTSAVVPTTIVHGDFAPWNLLVDDTRVLVFDWDHAVLDGIPEWDRLHYTLRVGLNIRRWSARRLTRHAHQLSAVGSTHFSPAQWRAVIVLSLINIRSNEERAGKSARIVATVDDALDSLLACRWLASADEQCTNPSLSARPAARLRWKR